MLIDGKTPYQVAWESIANESKPVGARVTNKRVGDITAAAIQRAVRIDRATRAPLELQAKLAHRLEDRAAAGDNPRAARAADQLMHHVFPGDLWIDYIAPLLDQLEQDFGGEQ